ncbi:DUF3021 domain-containing protein [Guggenheimella bovis]
MVLKNAIIRGAIPFAIMSIISYIMHRQGMDPAQVRSTFFTGIIIAVMGASSVLYDIESWSILKQSIVHFFIMLVTVFPCLIFSGWYELHTPLDYMKLFLFFILIGAVLWTFFYFLFTKILNK